MKQYIVNYPKHIAFIPDGNRTRAKERDLPHMVGHMEGQNTAIKLMKYIFTETPIEVATFWGLSTENQHKRSKEELEYLSTMYELVIDNIDDFLTEHNISFTWIGNPEGLPENVLNVLNATKEKHTYISDKTLVIAVNYGGKDEIIRGVKKAIASGMKEADITNESLSSMMDLGGLPPVELVVRTKGGYATRLSGFMSWWIGYAELYFTKLYYPDLSVEELKKALSWFHEIADHRNYGK